MTLDEIVLHDFGVYAGENKIQLTPTTDRPIILFGGLNGAGKTTILDALQLCLFGPAAQCSERGNSGYHEYLEQLIHRQSHYGQAAVGLVFRRFIEGKEVRYRVTRTWGKYSGKIRESLEVTIDKTPAPVIARNWQEHVSQIMPANIAHLFFFDGEKAVLYASPENARNLIQTAVHNLLGMDMVDQACRDLQILERRRRAENIRQIDRDTIAAKEAEIGDLEKQMSKLTEDCAEIQSQIIDPGRRKLSELNQSYREQGGALLDIQEKIERRLRRVKKCLASLDARMRSLSEGRLPILVLMGLLQWINEIGEKENMSRREQLLADELESRDEKILRLLPQSAEGQQIATIFKQFSKADIRRRREDAKREMLLNLDQNTEFIIADLTKSEKNRLATDLLKILDQWPKWKDRLDAASNEIDNIPKDDVVTEIIRTRDSLQKEVNYAEGKLSMMNDRRKHLQEQCEKLRQEIDEIERENTIIKLEHEDFDTISVT